jgi:hypothetical protein
MPDGHPRVIPPAQESAYLGNAIRPIGPALIVEAPMSGGLIPSFTSDGAPRVRLLKKGGKEPMGAKP